MAYAALAVTFVVLPGLAAALGPPSNSLRMLTVYQVDWVNPQTGQFGLNITFFRPANVAPQPGWTSLLTFRNPNLVIENYANPLQFALEANADGNLVTKCKAEAPAVVTAALAASDRQKGFRRMALFVNARVKAPANVQDLTPMMISLMPPNASTPVALVDQKDFQITALGQNLPQAPFGPFLGATTAEKAEAAEAVPSPKGTDLLETTGLYVTSVIFAIAATAFGYGVVDKMNSVKEFEALRGRPII